MCCVCRQVAGKEYSLWDAILVRGRKEGQEEMTVEELLKYVKVNTHTYTH